MLIYSDHHFNTKRGGVCVHYRCLLLLRVVNIGYLRECLSFELQIKGKILILQSSVDLQVISNNSHW